MSNLLSLPGEQSTLASDKESLLKGQQTRQVVLRVPIAVALQISLVLAIDISNYRSSDVSYRTCSKRKTMTESFHVSKIEYTHLVHVYRLVLDIVSKVLIYRNIVLSIYHYIEGVFSLHPQSPLCFTYRYRNRIH